MKKIQKKSGIIMTEALLAVALMATGVLILGGIITSAISTTKLSKDYMVAQNLASEAVEGIKNIRSTNWLVSPNDGTCWFSLEGVCGPNPIKGSSYTVNLKDDKWVMKYEANPLEITNTTTKSSVDNYLLYIEEITEGETKYSQYQSFANSNVSSTPSRFYRGVYVKEFKDEFADFEIKVQWKDGVKTRTLVRDLTLFNYK